MVLRSANLDTVPLPTEHLADPTKYFFEGRLICCYSFLLDFDLEVKAAYISWQSDLGIFSVASFILLAQGLAL